MEWDYHFALSRVTLTTGEKVGARPVMRRKTSDGKWEYRACTPEEEAKYTEAEAW